MHRTETLKRTPLYAAHLEWGAKMVPFGGWEMPVQYSGILEEHRAVRECVGLFDISHMGEFLIAGPNAEVVLNELFSNDLRKITVGAASRPAGLPPATAPKFCAISRAGPGPMRRAH